MDQIGTWIAPPIDFVTLSGMFRKSLRTDRRCQAYFSPQNRASAPFPL